MLSILILVTIVGVFSQSVNAVVFFDSGITLQGKSDPELRSVLANGQTYGTINVIVVFARTITWEERASLDGLGTVGTFTGHVATMTLTREALQQLSTLSFVERISYPKTLKRELDVSVPEILANRVWNTTQYEGLRDSQGNIVNGTGVIIGIADFGIDYLHKDFSFPNGTNKIIYIWDQSVQGSSNSHPSGFSYGWECTPTEISTRSCPEGDDSIGHGTAVAAVAASTGQASGRYEGVAPGASIVAVKLEDGNENHVLDALSYIIQKAHDLGRPVVIDHSLGYSVGSHDGTEPLEIAFDDFVMNGVPIVVSAGDSGDLNLHVDGNLTTGESVTVPWTVDKAQSEVDVDLWYSTSSTVSVLVTTPRGFVVSGPTSASGLETADGLVTILPDARSTGKEWWITITSITSTSLIREGWTFTVTGIAARGERWDAWLGPLGGAGGQFTNSTTNVENFSIDKSDTIDTPGTASGVITVGAYVTKYGWFARCTPCVQYASENGYKGFWWAPYSSPTESAALVGKMAPLSSIGPTRDGRIKPDIAAPGFNIAAARASTREQKNSDPDDYHQVWRGTSFAVPHVSGVIALMLQMNPSLSPQEIRTILTQDAREDKFTGKIDNQVGSPVWGWGKVNAFDSTRDAINFYAVRLEISIEPLGGTIAINLTLDGQNYQELTLNKTRTIILNFARGENHTVTLTPVIQLDPGARYKLITAPQNFSGGGAISFKYELQFFLEVDSAYGTGVGGGWYDANSTALATVVPTVAPGYAFQGWIGSVSSDSATVDVKMDSSKRIVAVWRPVSGSWNLSNILGLTAAIAISLAIAAFVRYKTYRRKGAHTLAY